VVFILGNSLIADPHIITEMDDHYLVNTDKYRLVIPKQSGMIESMRLPGSDFELVADYWAYSLYFTEFNVARPDGSWGDFFYPNNDASPPIGRNQVQINIIENTSELGIISVIWTTDLIDATWDYVFVKNEPVFRSSFRREVVSTGLYSNAQHCVMYSADMDDSYIIDYKGGIITTMGDYDGHYNTTPWSSDASDANPTMATHSLWTLFDYGSPQFLPTLAWHDDEEDITTGVITTWSSANQRASISYHGGGASGHHPGFAEGQWNWFGKSDSEALFLREGTSYAIELLFYQDYGHVDSLFQLSDNILTPDTYRLREIEDYQVASWGGNSSNLDRYFWRYPQVSSNSITSQRLFRPKAFAVSRSQNGMRDNHLFSISIYALINNEVHDLTPNYGHAPLFDSLSNLETDSSWIGAMSWTESDIQTQLSYELIEANSTVRIRTSINTTSNGTDDIEEIYAGLVSSNRAELRTDLPDKQWSFQAADAVLDSISIVVDDLEGLVGSSIEGDVLKFTIAHGSEFIDSAGVFDFSMRLVAFIDDKPAAEHSGPFKSHFVRLPVHGQSSTALIEPSSDYFVLEQTRSNQGLQMKIWIQREISEVTFYDEDFVPNYLYDFVSVQRFPVEASNQQNVYSIRANLSPGIYVLNSDTARSEDESCLFSPTFPNPTSSDKVFFNLYSNKSGFGTITIFDIRGRLLDESQFELNGRGLHEMRLKLDKKHYEAGIYFIRIDFLNETRMLKTILLD